MRVLTVLLLAACDGAPRPIPFTPRYELWSDGAEKRRSVQLPPGTSLDVSDPDHWQLPVGGKVWKEFSRDGVVLETRLIERTGPGPEDYFMGAFVGGGLVPDGARDVLGTTHDVPSQRACWSCHGSEPGRVIGLSAVQLDPAQRARLGVVQPMPLGPLAGDDVATRALGTLHASCGHCHHEGGVAWRDTDLVLRVSAAETHPEAAGSALAHGDAVLTRMAHRGDALQMPPLGTEIPDAAGLGRVREWISPVARGAYLTKLLDCTGCHTPRGADGEPDASRFLAGKPCFVDLAPDDPSTGCLSSRNLTNHATGLAGLTDAQIRDALLRGLRPTGGYLAPVMPFYAFHNMRPEDADAIVAFLRTVPGVDHRVPSRQAPWTDSRPSLPVPATAIPLPRPEYPEREAALRGRYLAGELGACIACHTAPARGSPTPLDLGKLFAGNRRFALRQTAFSANLTPHATGIAGYTVDDIVRVLEQGVARDGSAICPPMPVGPMGGFAALTDGDARDIAHYLLSLPPVENALTAPCNLPGTSGHSGHDAPTRPLPGAALFLHQYR